MRTVKKQVYLELESISGVTARDHCGAPRKLIYQFKGYEQIPNIESLELYVEVEEPETLSEFREQEGLSKSDLVDWLNRNYK